MFESWQNFYALTGAASGSLIGLMFIVATLTQNRRQSGIQQGAKLFTTPTVVHLTAVLALSALALAPASESAFTRPASGLAAALGLAYAAAIAVRLARMPTHTHWSDPWYYGAAPAAGYLGSAAAQAAVALDVPHAAWAMGMALLFLLVVAIRNAWDLVTWLAPRRSED